MFIDVLTGMQVSWNGGVINTQNEEFLFVIRKESK